MLKKIKIIAVLISLSISLCLMSNTYSRYVASSSNNVEALFAKWEILVNNTDVTVSNSSEITFEPIIDKKQNIAENVIAPSSTGYFDVEIDATNVDLSFKYKIDLNIENENIPDLLITKYIIIPDNYDGNTKLQEEQLNDSSITGTLSYDNSDRKFTIRIFFEWVEGNNETMNDEADTLVGTGENEKLRINANINFEQVL